MRSVVLLLLAVALPVSAYMVVTMPDGTDGIAFTQQELAMLEAKLVELKDAKRELAELRAAHESAKIELADHRKRCI